MRRQLSNATKVTIVTVMALALSGCSYNKFTTQEEAIKAQWAEVQNQLQRRNDLIPNLVETVKGYAAHEAGVFNGDRRRAIASCWRRRRRRKPLRRPTSRPPRSAGCSRSSRTTRTSRPTSSSTGCMDELSGTENRLAVARMRYNERCRSTTRSAANSPRTSPPRCSASRNTPTAKSRRRRRRLRRSISGNNSSFRFKETVVREASDSARARAGVGGHRSVPDWRARAGRAGASAGPAASPAINQSDDPILKPFVWRSIGPANMGGRVDDIAVVESDPSIIYIGFATGGIWKTTNNGTTWTPIFDKYPVSSIGDIAIAPSNPDDHLRRAPASRTTARARRSAPASTSRSTPARAFEDDGPERDTEHRAASSSIRRIRTSSTSRRSDTCSDRTRNAGSTRRPTAGRPGRTRSSSTRTRASPMS